MSDVIDQAEAIEATDRALRIDAVRAAAARLDGDAVEARDCDDCGDPIDPERLRAVPGARQCVFCREARERRGLGLGRS